MTFIHVTIFIENLDYGTATALRPRKGYGEDKRQTLPYLDVTGSQKGKKEMV